MDPVTRHSLIERLRDRADRDAWGEFWSLYEPLIRRYVARFHVPSPDADDLTQDIYLRLRDQMAGFELRPERGRFRAWLRRCTDNCVRDWLRVRARRDSATSPLDVASLADSFGDGHEADNAREIEWRRAVLATVLERVEREFRGNWATWECFRLATLENRPAAEIASRLGIAAVNNVHVYAHRVLARVKALCREYDEEGDDVPFR